MATFIKGDAVTNATSYELLEKTAEGVYSSLAEASEINFEVSALGLAAGDHTLVVKAKAAGYEDSDPSNELVYTVAEEPDESTVFDFDFTTNNIDDYALSEIFTVPEGTDTSTIEYDATYGMTLDGQLVNGLNLVNPIDASKAWTLDFTALFVTPTVLAGNRRALLGGADLYPFVFINGNTFDSMGFQISNGSHKTIYGADVLAYDKEANYKIHHDGNGAVTVTVDGVEKGNVTCDFSDKNFTVILGNVAGKSSAYVWDNVEEGKKSYLHKMKFYYN